MDKRNTRFTRPSNPNDKQLTLADFLVGQAQQEESRDQREIGGYRRDDPDTSEAAAKSIDVARLDSAILKALRAYPKGLTTRELAMVCGIDWGSITPRMKPLEEKGKVVRTDERRRWKSGRLSIVWKIKD